MTSSRPRPVRGATSSTGRAARASPTAWNVTSAHHPAVLARYRRLGGAGRGVGRGVGRGAGRAGRGGAGVGGLAGGGGGAGGGRGGPGRGRRRGGARAR